MCAFVCVFGCVVPICESIHKSIPGLGGQSRMVCARECVFVCACVLVWSLTEVDAEANVQVLAPLNPTDKSTNNLNSTINNSV